MKFKKLKVCGLTCPKDFEKLEGMGVDFGGIVFYPPSPRYAGESLIPQKIKKNKTLQRVGVFVNSDVTEIKNKIGFYQLDYVQLHGDESVDFCANLKDRVKIIKAFRVESEADLEKISDYEGVCDYFLFDTATPQYGGSGKQFNWNILKNYTSTAPYFLSGGIGLDSLTALKKIDLPHCIGLDVNSKFEIEPGIKNINLIHQFICQLPTL